MREGTSATPNSLFPTPLLRTKMLYREAGQFKTSYAADMAIFPIRQDRIALALLLAFAFVGVPLLANFHVWPFGSDYLLRAILHPVPDPGAGRHRPEHPDRLLRADLARQRRLHGDRCLLRLQVRHRHPSPAGLARHRDLDPAAAGVAVDPARRPDVGHRRHPVRHSEPAHQGPLSRGCDAGRPVLLRLGVHPREVVHQLRAVRLGDRARAQFLRPARSTRRSSAICSASSS